VIYAYESVLASPGPRSSPTEPDGWDILMALVKWFAA
jgi:hypothetical protein